MKDILLLILTALLPVAFSAVFYLADKKTPFGRLKDIYKQLIIGVVFGGIAVISTELGIKVGGATLNIRNAAPMSAGFIFGPVAGITAGIIGGVERWFAAYWGAGEYTQLACTIATIFAGIIAALFRKYMFDGKKPTWIYAMFIAGAVEVLHMFLVFLTNFSDLRNAFEVVLTCAFPMIIVNALSVTFSIVIVTFLSKERIFLAKESKKIAQSFQKWLFICICFAFVLTAVFTYFIQDGISSKNTEELLGLNMTDVKNDITYWSDEFLLSMTEEIAENVDVYIKAGTISNYKILQLCMNEDVSEINIVATNGLITYSSNADFVGYDMASGPQSTEFMVLLDGKTKSYVQSYQSISYDENIKRKYAGVALKSGGFVQVGLNGERFQRVIDEQVVGATRNRHIGESGFMIICDEEWNIVSNLEGNEGQNLSVTGLWIDTKETPQNTVFRAIVYDTDSYCCYGYSEGYYIVAIYLYNEAIFFRNVSLYTTLFLEIMVFAVLFIAIYFLVKRVVVDNMIKVNASLAKITNGNLDEVVNVRTNEEFASLSNDINSTVTTLKRYIAEAEARIDKELEFAKAIQYSALPSVFPPYPGRKDFDIYAAMFTAKEVGGDFYDFYMLNDETLFFLVADVSGKGIPAAMFMMTAKTLIKSLAETGIDITDVLSQANEKLCENNDAGMFVTVWAGCINLKTGLVTYVNAGHNPPLLKKQDGSCEYVKVRPGFVLAGMEGIRYRKHELHLEKGDTLFLYTDGVTEATDANTELYGEDRLICAFENVKKYASVQEICTDIKNDVDGFVKEAPQFDDITMLAFKFNGMQ